MLMSHGFYKYWDYFDAPKKYMHISEKGVVLIAKEFKCYQNAVIYMKYANLTLEMKIGKCVASDTISDNKSLVLFEFSSAS